MKTIFGGASLVVENLTIECRGGGDPVSIGPVHEGVDTISFSLVCEDDGIVTGIEGTADQLLDSLALQCR